MRQGGEPMTSPRHALDAPTVSSPTAAGRLTVLAGVLVWLLVVGAAVAVTIEAVAMLGRGFDAFAERSERLPAPRQAVMALVPFTLVVLAPRWVRVLLHHVQERPWAVLLLRALTVVAIIGTLTAMVVFAFTFDVMVELFEGSRPGELLIAWGFSLMLWSLIAPFTHPIGVAPRSSAPAEVWGALVAGGVLRALCLSMPLMVCFWAVTSIVEVLGYNTVVVDEGIAEQGTGGWMLALLVLQVVLLAILATALADRVSPSAREALAVFVAVTVGVVVVVDSVATRQVGWFHLLSLVVVVPGALLGLRVRRRRISTHLA